MSDDNIFGDEPESPAPAPAPAAHSAQIKITMPGAHSAQVEIAAPAPAKEPEVAASAPAAPQAPEPVEPAAPKAPEAAIEKNAEMLLSKLFKHGKIVKVSIGKWEGKRKLSAKDLGLDQADVPEELFTLGQKRLVKKSSFEAVRSIESKARSLSDSNSYESWIPGLRFMTDKAAAVVLSELAELKGQYEKAADEFVTQYPALRDSMLKEFPKYAKALEPLYPEAAKVRKAFYFQFDSFTITMVRTEEAGALESAKIGMKQELMKKLDGFYKSSVVDTRAKFVEELELAKKKLDGGDKVHGKTVKKINQMIDQVKTSSFVEDKEFFAMLDDLKKDLHSVNEEVFKKGVQKKIEAALSAAKKTEDVTEVVESYKRSILV